MAKFKLALWIIAIIVISSIFVPVEFVLLALIAIAAVIGLVHFARNWRTWNESPLINGSRGGGYSSSVDLTGIEVRYPQDPYLDKFACPVRGIQFGDRRKQAQGIQVGNAIQLHREAHNPEDANAIEVFWDGRKIGYIPREIAEVMGPDMDRGNTFRARVNWTNGEYRRLELFLLLERTSGSPPERPKRRRKHKESATESASWRVIIFERDVIQVATVGLAVVRQLRRI